MRSLPSFFHPIIIGFIFCIHTMYSDDAKFIEPDLKMYTFIFSMGCNVMSYIPLSIQTSWRYKLLAPTMAVGSFILLFSIGIVVFNELWSLHQPTSLFYITSIKTHVLCFLIIFTVIAFPLRLLTYYIFERPGARFYIPG
jgi:hypothetical protein